MHSLYFKISIPGVKEKHTKESLETSIKMFGILVSRAGERSCAVLNRVFGRHKMISEQTYVLMQKYKNSPLKNAPNLRHVMTEPTL